VPIKIGYMKVEQIYTRHSLKKPSTNNSSFSTGARQRHLQRGRIP